MPFDRRRFVAVPFAAGILAWAGQSARAVAAEPAGPHPAGSPRSGPGGGVPAGHSEPAAPNSPAPAAPFEESVPYTSGTEGYASFRIPALIRTRRGTLVAFAEARAGSSDTGRIVVVAKRSRDGGRTWGPPVVVAGDGTGTQGNPSPVVDPHTGDLVLLTCTNAAEATEAAIMAGQVRAGDGRRVWVQRSTDDGRTFSPPSEITARAKRPEWRWYATGPGHAIALTAGPHRGRLVVPANHSTPPPPGSSDTGTEAKYYGGHCLLSDDGGRTWRIGFTDDTPDGVVNANESTAAQLPDGKVYFNARNQNGTAPAPRVDAWSRDGGATLVRPYAPQPALAGPVVQGSVLQTPGGPLVFAGPSDPSVRAAMALRVSDDEGRTWATAITLSQLPAGYSDLTLVDAGTLGLLYETGTSSPYSTLVFVRIPLPALRRS
ncbi:sialidase family protein [Actinacidiphila acidipaludis]|uniref:exo-alpha-sialidase n=1 Tax=Actinacidiphila acidipaludis TaxID=2873382 RepID=A0ABS7QHS1_9ACTN|nr:sialidase family protein [Streptomyces acidipaludis]MBY8881477.1 glycoside hydrolase [Streptomyces acidipaludis]